MHQGVLWRDPSLSHVCVKRRVLKKGPCSSHEILRSSLVQKGFVACLGPPFLLYPASSPALGKRRKSLESFLKLWTGYLASGVEGIAAVLIAFAAIQAALRAIVLFIKRGQGSLQSQEPQTELLRLRLGRWLALALEFELGADILRTAIAPTWNEIGQLAAIATIRTALNYFLQQEIDRAARRQPDLALQAQPPLPTEQEQCRDGRTGSSDHAHH